MMMNAVVIFLVLAVVVPAAVAVAVAVMMRIVHHPDRVTEWWCMH